MTTNWHEYGPPISVEGGVRARSRRGSIGEQWWSRRFIDVLESFGMAGRLARGRNYARRGQVIGFEISCGYVTAQVQGSRPKPYRVRIQVTPLTKPQWRRVEQALAAQALLLRLGVLGLALELDPEALGEQLERALEVDALDLLDEREDVAGGIAAEAVIDLLLGVDAERGRALLVEGAAPLVARGPGAAQLGVRGDELDEVDGVADAVLGVGGIAGHCCQRR